MGRGSSKAGTKDGGDLQGKGGDAGKVTDVQDMLSQRSTKEAEVDEVMAVAQRMNNLFGEGDKIQQYQTANMTGNAMAYYDTAGNIAINNRYMNNAGVDKAMDVASKNRFHPDRGNKSGMQALASHEYGHALSDRVAQRLGSPDIETASREIVNRARAKTGHKTNMGFAEKISGYATYNFAECVAEATSDWYCNGSKAKKESRAVVSVMNSILKKGK